VISQFEKEYRKGGGATGARVRAERKLAILDKVCMCLMTLVADCAMAEVVKSLASPRGDRALI
jgi:hypothetical protein